MIHFFELVGQRGFQRRLLEAHMTLDPFAMLLRPCFGPFRGPAAVSQKKLSQSIPRLQLILLGRFPRPHQIAQGFVI